LGWTGDAQIFIRTGCFNMDISAFHTKWIQDVMDAQSEKGAFTDVVPHVGYEIGMAAFGDAGIIIPWNLYLYYGDKRILEKHYNSFKKHFTYLCEDSHNFIRPDIGYGDWLATKCSIWDNRPADTAKDMMSTAYFAYMAELMQKIALTLGKPEDASMYRDFYEKIRSAFQEEYITSNGRIISDSQTTYLLALKFDLIPEHLREKSIRRLLTDIKNHGEHLSTGFFGCMFLLPVLVEEGQLDLAYKLLLNDTFPSWGFSIKNGATTMWERWDSWTPENGFQTVAMNSFNHYALGSVGEFLYQYIAGIGLDENNPAFKNIIIHPRPGGGLTWTKAKYDSIYGSIKCNWKIENNTFHLKVTIPANAMATIHIPTSQTNNIQVKGKAITTAEGILNIEYFSHSVICQVQSGDYDFQAPYQQ